MALELERNGVIQEALDLYEDLHAEDPNSLTISNNYASMLAYYGEGEQAVERANTIIAPFTGNASPAFLDTVGFIRMRQGDNLNAILNFQAAARALPENPTIAFNLAEAYRLAGRLGDARTQLERGFRLAGENTDIPRLTQAVTLRDELDQQNDQ